MLSMDFVATDTECLPRPVQGSLYCEPAMVHQHTSLSSQAISIREDEEEGEWNLNH